MLKLYKNLARIFKRMITKFQILGERNSGTNYLLKVMNFNFDLEHTSEYGFKHWFIKDHHPRGPPNKTTDRDCVTPLSDSDNTLFIFIVREPIEWLQSMHRQPHHANLHRQLSFSDFIQRGWISFEPTNPNSTSYSSWESENGIYWIEGSENIITLRNMKNQHFMNVEAKVPHFHLIRQHKLKEDIEEMKSKYDLRCKHDTLLFPDYRVPKEKVDVLSEDMTFIKEYLDKSIETKLGFDVV